MHTSQTSCSGLKPVEGLPFNGVQAPCRRGRQVSRGRNHSCATMVISYSLWGSRALDRNLIRLSRHSDKQWSCLSSRGRSVQILRCNCNKSTVENMHTTDNIETSQLARPWLATVIFKHIQGQGWTDEPLLGKTRGRGSGGCLATQDRATILTTPIPKAWIRSMSCDRDTILITPSRKDYR